MLHKTILAIWLLLGWLTLTTPSYAQTQDIDSLCAKLRSSASADRIAALQRLATMEAEQQAIEPLMAALADPSPAVRCEALKTWGQVGEAYDRLVSESHSHHRRRSEVERTAETKIWQDWQKRLLAGIGTSLNSQSSILQKAALRSLAHWYDSVESIYPPYYPSCIIPTPGISLESKVGAVLCQFAQKHLNSVVALTREADPQIVYCGISILIAIKYPSTPAILNQFLRHPDPVWRMIGCNGLSESKNVDTLLTPLLSDEDARVRACAIHNLDAKEKVLERLAKSFRISSVPLKRSILLMIKQLRWQDEAVSAAVLQDACAGGVRRERKEVAVVLSSRFAAASLCSHTC